MLKDGQYDHSIGTHITLTTPARIIDAMQRCSGRREDTAGTIVGFAVTPERRAIASDSAMTMQAKPPLRSKHFNYSKRTLRKYA